MLVKACKTLGYDFLQNCLLDVGVCLVLQYGTKLYLKCCYRVIERMVTSEAGD